MKSLACASLLRPILEYVAECCDLYRKVQVIASDQVQKQAAKLATRTNESVGETLAQRRRTARMWALFKGYGGERTCKGIGDRLQGLCYLSSEDHNRRIRGRKKRRYWVIFV